MINQLCPACSSFSSYCLSPLAAAHGKRGREDRSLWFFLEPNVVQGHLRWCHVKLHYRPGSKEWVRSAFITIPYLFLSDILPAVPKKILISSCFYKRKYWPISNLKVISAVFIDSSGITDLGSGFTLNDGHWWKLQKLGRILANEDVSAWKAAPLL